MAVVKLKIGKNLYSVHEVESLHPSYVTGRIHYPPARKIEISQMSGKSRRRRSLSRMQHTLWHELVHGMLYEMGSRKHRDEFFVDSLATMILSLNRQIHRLNVGGVITHSR